MDSRLSQMNSTSDSSPLMQAKKRIHSQLLQVQFSTRRNNLDGKRGRVRERDSDEKDTTRATPSLWITRTLRHRVCELCQSFWELPGDCMAFTTRSSLYTYTHIYVYILYIIRHFFFLLFVPKIRWIFYGMFGNVPGKLHLWILWGT